MYHEVCGDRPEACAWILEHALANRCRFSLVWRDQLTFGASALEIAETLKPSLLSEIRTDRWPGTTLWETMATVRLYGMNSDSFACVSRVPRLFQWRAPDLPEDLAIYDSDGTCCVACISHEHVAWIDLASPTLNELRSPGPLFEWTGRTADTGFPSVGELMANHTPAD